MTKKAKQYPNPKFSNLEEENEYWKTHSPLDEGYEGKVQKSRRKRSSFLSIRLTGEELTQLRNMAANFGTGPSTYARQVLKLAIEQKNWVTHNPPFPPPSFLFPPLYDSADKHEIKLRRSRKSEFRLPDDSGRAEKAYAAYIEAHNALDRAIEPLWGDKKTGKRICIFDPDEMEVDPATLHAILNAIFKAYGVRVVTPEDNAYKTVERIVKTQP